MSHKVPKLLLGHSQDVRRACDKLCKKAIKNMSWTGLVSPDEMVDIESCEQPLFINGPARTLAPDGIQMFWVIDRLTRQACANLDLDYNHPIGIANRITWRNRICELMISGFSEFWIALAILASHNAGIHAIILHEPRKVQLSFASTMLKGLLQWWPDFCRIENQFRCAHGLLADWPHWIRVIRVLGQHIGIDRDTLNGLYLMNHDGVEKTMRDWLAASNKD